MLEKDLQRKFITLLKKEYPDIYAVKLMVTNQRGFPDLMLIKNGKILLIELKSEKGRVSPIQKYQHGLLASQQIQVEIVRTIEEAKRLINEL